LEGGIEGAFADLQDFLGDLLQVLCDAVAVRTTREQGPEDQEIQGAGEGFRRVPSHRLAMGASAKLGILSSSL
jgi:hypothetical protein